MGTRRSTTGLESADLGERSNERRGRAFCAAADGGELGSDLNGPPPLARERGVDGVPTLLLLVPPGVEGRWLDDGVEGRGLVEDGVDGRWLEEGVLGLPLLLMGDSFGPDLPMATSIKNRTNSFFFLFTLSFVEKLSEITEYWEQSGAPIFLFCWDQTETKTLRCSCNVQRPLRSKFDHFRGTKRHLKTAHSRVRRKLQET